MFLDLPSESGVARFKHGGLSPLVGGPGGEAP